MIDTIPAQKAIYTWAVSKGWRGPDVPKVIDCDNEGRPLPDAKPREKRTFGDEIALVTSELIEALEQYRDNDDPTHVWYAFELNKGKDFADRVANDPNSTPEDFKVIDVIEKFMNGHMLRAIGDGKPLTDEEWGLLVDAGIAKPEGVPVELADAAIRLLDNCENAGIDLGYEIRRKMRYNETRAFRHGGRNL